MKEEYVTYECAVKLKELGFKDKCNAYYWTEDKALERTNSIVHKNSDTCQTVVMAPFLWQAQKWLREVKGVEVVVEPRFCNYKRIGYDWNVYDDCSNDYALRAPLPFSETYELALSDGISGALELLTNNSK